MTELRLPYATNGTQPADAADLQAAYDWLCANVVYFLADPRRKVQATLHFAGGKFGGGSLTLPDVRPGESVVR